mmetsp:Transcript_56864/g.132555  ORF Transcript_56864/g.132555 Transcript_56864/m.132555 type:complete len:284 (+) Transcript_56864:257-1108(+)
MPIPLHVPSSARSAFTLRIAPKGAKALYRNKSLPLAGRPEILRVLRSAMFCSTLVIVARDFAATRPWCVNSMSSVRLRVRFASPFTMRISTEAELPEHGCTALTSMLVFAMTFARSSLRFPAAFPASVAKAAARAPTSCSFHRLKKLRTQAATRAPERPAPQCPFWPGRPWCTAPCPRPRCSSTVPSAMHASPLPSGLSLSELAPSFEALERLEALAILKSLASTAASLALGMTGLYDGWGCAIRSRRALPSTWMPAVRNPTWVMQCSFCVLVCVQVRWITPQ